MLKRIIARYLLKRAIKYHEQMRVSIMYARGYPINLKEWEKHVEENDELWHRAAAEYRCAERIKKLLNER